VLESIVPNSHKQKKKGRKSKKIGVFEVTEDVEWRLFPPLHFSFYEQITGDGWVVLKAGLRSGLANTDNPDG